MPPNSEHATWCEEARRLLALAAAERETELREAWLEQQQREAEEAEDAKAFGAGYKAFDQRELQPLLKDAVAAGRMISAADWTEAAPALSAKQRGDLLADAGTLQASLAGLAAARATQKLLAADVATAKVAVEPLDKSIEALAGAPSGPALLPAGQVGLPAKDFAAQLKAADANWLAMLKVQWALEEVKPATEPSKAAMVCVKAWKDYWFAIKGALTKAQADGQPGFDPSLYAKPTALPDLAPFPAAAQCLDGHTPYATPTLPPAKLKAADFAGQISAARQNAAAMHAAASALDRIAQPTAQQAEACKRVKAWKAYWQTLEIKLTTEQSAIAADFDLASVPKPAELPDLAALAGGPEVSRRYADIAGKSGADAPLQPAQGKLGPGAYTAAASAASDKWYQMFTTTDAFDTLPQPLAPSQEDAKTHLAAWSSYWYAVKNGLEAAENGTLPEFDLDSIPKPAAPPPDLLAQLALAAPKGGAALAPAGVPGPKIAPAAYDAEIKAADEKWSAMLSAQWAQEKIAVPTQAQQKTLALTKDWKDYWAAMKAGLKLAKQDAAPGFDTNSIKPPAERPDFSAPAERAELARVSQIESDHEATAIKPIEADMSRCLPLLDAPENNPEREHVGSALALLEKLPAGPLTPALAGQRTQALAELERQLFAWNDRRTREHLPPAAEAVAMADLLQIEHRKLIDEVAAKKLPLPVADIDAIDPAEAARMQASWAQLRDNAGPLTISTAFDPANKKKGASTSEAQAKEFRAETLANAARLLGSASGRKLLRELEDSGQTLSFVPGESAACQAVGGGIGKSRPQKAGSTDEITTEQDARAHKGSGSGAKVMMPRGAKDSDVCLCTKEGGQLHSPRFIAMGHEMVHALHMARGIDRDQIALAEDPVWNNSEELYTINKGKLSEQTLRAQYGLSAERFGHKHTEAGSPVADAFGAALKAADTIAKDGEPAIAEKLKVQGFGDVEGLTEKTRVAIAAAPPPLGGPLPRGWDANQLSVEQMRVIIARKLPANLAALGWSPFDLKPAGPGDSLEDVLGSQRHHPRSPHGLRFRALGGEAALKAVTAFQTAAKVKLAAWTETSWPSQLAALEAAESWFAGFAEAKGGEVAKLAGAKLALKLPQLTELLKQQPQAELDKDPAHTGAAAFAKAGGLPALARIGQLNTLLGTQLPAPAASLPAMQAALDKAGAWLDAFVDATDALPNDGLLGIVQSSLRSSSSMVSKLDNVILCCRRGRAVQPDYLDTAIKAADKVL